MIGTTNKLLVNNSNELENVKEEMENDRFTLNLILNQKQRVRKFKTKSRKGYCQH